MKRIETERDPHSETGRVSLVLSSESYQVSKQCAFLFFLPLFPLAREENACKVAVWCVGSCIRVSFVFVGMVI